MDGLPGAEPKSEIKPGTFTVTLLYFAELQGLKIDHAPLGKEAKAKGDRWFISSGGDTQGPLPLEAVFKLLLQGKASISILHASNAQDDTPLWRAITYRAVWSNPKMALIWTATVWVIAALMGWIVISLVTPLPIRGPVEVVYWVVAACAVTLICVPAKIRDRVKSRFKKKAEEEAAMEDER